MKKLALVLLSFVITSSLSAMMDGFDVVYDAEQSLFEVTGAERLYSQYNNVVIVRIFSHALLDGTLKGRINARKVYIQTDPGTARSVMARLVITTNVLEINGEEYYAVGPYIPMCTHGPYIQQCTQTCK